MLEKLQQSVVTRPPANREGQSQSQAGIVPFEEFSKMFEEYTEAAAKEKERARKEVDACASTSGKEGRSSSSGDHRRISLKDPGEDEVKFDPDAAMTAVQYLAKEDPLFDSFLKMSLRDKPAGRVSTYITTCAGMVWIFHNDHVRCS